MKSIFHIFILNIYDLWTYFVDNIFKRVCANLFIFLLNALKYFYRIQIILFTIKHSLELICLSTTITISSQLNGSNYGYLTQIYLCIIIHLFADCEVVTSIAI